MMRCVRLASLALFGALISEQPITPERVLRALGRVP